MYEAMDAFVGLAGRAPGGEGIDESVRVEFAMTSNYAYEAYYQAGRERGR